MKLDYLPKLLLQHDESPFLNDLNLIKACESEKFVYCVHPRRLDIAVALGQRLVLFRASSTISPTSPTHTTDPPHFITPTQAPESISSLAWLWSASTNDSCLAVGTSAGFFQLHSFPEGTLLHRQELGDTAILSIIVRWSGSGLDPQDSAEEITIGFDNAVVRIPTYDIWPAVRWHLRAVQLQQATTTATNNNIGKHVNGSTTHGTTWWGGTGIGSIVHTTVIGHAPQITPTKYYFKKSMGPRTASACVGPAAPSLSSLLARRQDLPHRSVIFTVGSDPPCASFIVEESQNGGSILSLVAGLATSSASELFGRAKRFLPGTGASSLSGVRGSGGVNLGGRASTQTPHGGGGDNLTPINSNSLTPQAMSATTTTTTASDTVVNAKKREKIPGITIYQESTVWDEAKRKVIQMALSPCCRWGACCDSLGRVLLIDIASCIVLKMLKGYREAQAVWFIPSEHTKDSTTAATALLVVYAPRRGVVEVWKPHVGVRVGSISAAVPQRGVLLEQPAVPTSLVNTQKRKSQISSPTSSSSSSTFSNQYQWRSFQSNSCWMLDLESLDLVNLTEKLNQLIEKK